MAKPVTTYTSVTKNSTTFAVNASPASWQLNSTVVTLNSTLYRLNGYTTATTPNQLNNKSATAYS